MSETHESDMLDGYDFSGGVRGKYAERYAESNIIFRLNPTPTAGMPWLTFEERVRLVLSAYYGVDLAPGFVPEVHKKFDCVSADKSIIGDAKHYTLVNGAKRPPAKIATITEYVWLLEKTKAPDTFLVFGNDRRVPELWLKGYGSLLSGVKFFFLHDDNRLELLSHSRRTYAREGRERKVPVSG